jgi:hypothetical protein
MYSSTSVTSRLLESQHFVPLGYFALHTGLRPALAVSMEDVASDQVSKSASHYDIGGEVLQTAEACNRDSRRGPISEPLHPGLGIFVRDGAGGRPGDDRMSGGNELSKPLV